MPLKLDQKEFWILIIGIVGLGALLYVLFKSDSSNSTTTGLNVKNQVQRDTSIPNQKKKQMSINETNMTRERCEWQCKTSASDEEHDECISKCNMEVSKIYLGNENINTVPGKNKCDDMFDQRSCNQKCYHLINNWIGYRSCQTACQLDSLRNSMKCMGIADNLYEIDKIGV